MTSPHEPWPSLLDRLIRAYPTRGYRSLAASLRASGHDVSDHDVRRACEDSDLATPEKRVAYARAHPSEASDAPNEVEARVATAEALVREGKVRDTLRRTRGDNRALVQQAVDQASFLEEVGRLVRQMPPYPAIVAPSLDNRQHQPKTLCLVLSDLHIGYIISRADAQGMGEYDLDIFRRRVARLTEAIAAITADERANSVVDNLCVFMLGDNVENVTMHPDQAHQTATLTDQLCTGTEVLTRGLFRPLAGLFSSIHVRRVLGNHGRIGEHGQRPFRDSYDTIFYRWLETRLETVPNITWGPIESYDDVVRLHGWTIRATHGQHQKGNARVPLVPARNGVRDFTATYRDVPDVSISGHLHSAAWGLDNSTHLLCNGSMPGVSEYGLKLGLSETPMQLLFAVNDRAPVQALYPIYLEDRARYGHAAPPAIFA